MARDSNSSAKEIEELESKYVRRRITAFRLNPIKGNFDIEHLKAINNFLFQDLPNIGLIHVTPGEFRKAVSPYSNWVKERKLEGMDVSYTVYYSTMAADSINNLKDTLKKVNPEEFSKLNTEKFTENLSNLYSTIDL